jgi:hypothetical protein
MSPVGLGRQVFARSLPELQVHPQVFCRPLSVSSSPHGKIWTDNDHGEVVLFLQAPLVPRLPIGGTSRGPRSRRRNINVSFLWAAAFGQATFAAPASATRIDFDQVFADATRQSQSSYVDRARKGDRLPSFKTVLPEPGLLPHCEPIASPSPIRSRAALLVAATHSPGQVGRYSSSWGTWLHSRAV